MPSTLWKTASNKTSSSHCISCRAKTWRKLL